MTNTKSLILFCLYVLLWFVFVGAVEAENPFRSDYIVTSPYHSTIGKGGERRNGLHQGIDLWCADPIIFPCEDGAVAEIGIDPVFGKYVIIYHPVKDYYSLYGHGSTIYYSAVGSVGRNTPIMKMGSTGYSSGPHLHFAVFRVVDGEREYFDPGEVLEDDN